MKRLFCSISIPLVIFGMICLLSFPASAATTHTVGIDGTVDFTSIIDALNDISVVSGDTIVVNPGTYSGSIDFKGKNVTLRSVGGPEVTTIIGSYGKSVVSFTNGETSAAVLDGFTITGGTGTYFYSDYKINWAYGYYGGGILINNATAPTIKNCIITGNGNNTISGGGGVAVLNTFGETVTISDTIISDNDAKLGGGVYVDSNSFPHYPGGIELPTHLVMKNCQVIGNTSYQNYPKGAGIFSISMSPIGYTPAGITLDLTNCMINNNTLAGSYGQGGGIAAQTTQLTLKNCTVASNKALGSNNTSGVGIFFYGRIGLTPSFPITILNSIIWGNSGYGPDSTKQIQIQYSNGTSISYSDVGPESTQYVYTFNNNMIADPLFVDPVYADHHLLRCSPCIDAGINTDAPSDDIDGDYRPIGAFVDMGADESLEDSSFVCSSPQQPVADAGPDQTVDEGVSVTLGGTESQGDSLQWEQLSGTEVILDDPHIANPSFTAPLLTGGTANEVLSFKLTAENSDEASDQATVNITVVNINTPPVAYAGDDQQVSEGVPVTLDGSASYDIDDDTLSYTWIQTSGEAVNLIDADTSTPQFTALLIDGGSDGESLILEFQLDLFDGFDHTYDTVVVTVEQVNHEPTADAGNDQTVNIGDNVSLYGLGFDPDNDELLYEWSQTGGGPDVGLSDVQSMDPYFLAPDVMETTQLTFQLSVSDGLAQSSDEVVITVLSPNAPPQCDLAVATPSSLWPPNHKLIDVSISGITDADNDNVTITILGVTQDEQVNDLGDGDTGPDAIVQGDTALIRAERSGNGDGRVYNIQFSAEDDSGASCEGTVEVNVLHERKKGEVAVDNGQLFDSTDSY